MSKNQPSQYNLRSASSSGQVGTEKMASLFASRDDPEYLKHMKDELIKSQQSREEETKLLQSVLSRMDKLEVKQSTTTTMGRDILRTPLKSGLHNEV